MFRTEKAENRRSECSAPSQSIQLFEQILCETRKNQSDLDALLQSIDEEVPCNGVDACREL